MNITLKDFRFPENIIDLVMHCVSATSLSLKWNNEKLPNFAPKRGSRQDDPLPPYFFLLCMEKLAIFINELVRVSRWQPISITRHGPKVSHLIFVDDCLLFTKVC